MIMMLLIAGAGVYFFSKKGTVAVPQGPATGSGGGVMPKTTNGWWESTKDWMSHAQGSVQNDPASARSVMGWLSRELFATQVSERAGLPTAQAYQSAYAVFPLVYTYVQYNASWPPASTVEQWLAEAWAVGT
jgi:hypothetical protein